MLRVLALDQSLKRTGWALIQVDKTLARLKVDTTGWFTAIPGDDDRAKVDIFKQVVRELVLDLKPSWLVWERPALFRGIHTSAVLARLDEALVALADELQLCRDSVGSQTWRAKVLGKGAGRLDGKAAKDRALLHCALLGVSVTNSDQAEAVCIGIWAVTCGKASQRAITETRR